MKFLRSLMEEAKPEAEKSPISKADQRTYASQVKKTFAGDEKFKTGKVSRAKFASAAMDCIDNCPKNGNCDETHKTACVKAMWNGYRAKHDGVTEGVIVEAWDDSGEDADVIAAEDEVKKRGIKAMSPRAEKALHKRLEKGDKRDENSGAGKVKGKSKEEEEEVTEAATPKEATKGGFAEFLKQK